MSFHFISGLPRSGSTLLAALLRQNPRFHADMTSGLGSLVSGAMQIMSPGTDVGSAVSEQQRKDILRGLFDNYYQSLTDRPVVVDTNRQWTSRMTLINRLFPEARVIACVRDLSWVVDSLELQVRNNPYHFTRLFGPNNQGTVFGRAEALMGHDALIGRAYTGLKEAFYGEHSASLLVIEYDLLAKAPEKIMPLVYQFLGEPEYLHDFENVEYDAPEYDEALGVSGLHKVRPKVEFVSRRTILPPDLFKRFQGMEFWRDLNATQANVITTKPANSEEH